MALVADQRLRLKGIETTSADHGKRRFSRLRITPV